MLTSTLSISLGIAFHQHSKWVCIWYCMLVVSSLTVVRPIDTFKKDWKHQRVMDFLEQHRSKGNENQVTFTTNVKPLCSVAARLSFIERQPGVRIWTLKPKCVKRKCFLENLKWSQLNVQLWIKPNINQMSLRSPTPPPLTPHLSLSLSNTYAKDTHARPVAWPILPIKYFTLFPPGCL